MKLMLMLGLALVWPPAVADIKYTAPSGIQYYCLDESAQLAVTDMIEVRDVTIQGLMDANGTLNREIMVLRSKVMVLMQRKGEIT